MSRVQFSRLSIRVKLLIPIFIALIVAFMVFWARVPLPVNALIEENIHANFSTVLNDLQTPFARRIDAQMRDLLTLSTSVEMQGYLDARNNSTSSEQILAQAALGSLIVGRITDGNLPYNQIRFIDLNGRMVVHANARVIGDSVSGVLLPVVNLPTQVLDRDYRKILGLSAGRGYLFPAQLSQPSANTPTEPLIEIGVPIFYQWKAVGVLIGSFRARNLLTEVFGQSGAIARYQSLLVDQGGQVVALVDTRSAVGLLGDQAVVAFKQVPPAPATNADNLYRASERIYQESQIDNLSGLPADHWRLIVSDDLRSAYAESQSLQETLALTLGVVFAIIAGGVIVVSQTVIHPLLEVSNVADRIANGDLTAKAPMNSQDEVGMVARALNTMTSRLSESIHTLEQRVRERTRDLEVTADISRQITTIFDMTELLQAAATRTREGFNLYHVAVFLYDPSSDMITFEAGIDTVGTVAKSAGLRFATDDFGLIAEAARKRRIVLANDVLNDARYVPTPLLPDTRSELALPMSLGERLIGVLDCQSELLNRFSAHDVRVMTTLAEQIAIAVNNVQLFRASQNARHRAEVIGQVSSHVTQAADEQAILKSVAFVAFGYGASQAILSYFDTSESRDPPLMSVVAYTSADGKQLPIGVLSGKPFSEIAYPGLKWVFRAASEPIYITDIETDPYWEEHEKKTVQQMGMGAVVLLPLKSGGQWQGLMSFGWDTPQVSFNIELKELLVILMPRLADNIARRRAYLSAQTARQETERLYRVSQEMNAAQSYIGIVEAIARSLNDPSYNLTLSLYEHYDKAKAAYFDIVAIRPAGQPIVIDPHLRFEANLIEGWAKDTLFIVEDLSKPSAMNELTAAYYRQQGVGGMMAAGLLLGQRVIGLLNLTTPTARTFTLNEKNFLRSAADLTAAAIERTRLYNEQVRVAEQLREIDMTKSRFLASMSHELRTPLNAILNFSKFVARGMLGPVNEKQVDALNKAITSGHHLLSLINDVLDMTKIESNMLTLFIENNVDVRAELQTVMAAAETLLADKPVQLINQIASDLPLVVGDKRRIRQIMFNLVSNACKFTTQGSITVCAEREDENNMILMYVRDTGPGIAPDEQEMIFEAFRQTEAGLHQGGGTGLGLPIARRLAEAHGGQLWVESALGAGATFFVRLPITPVQQAGTGAISDLTF